ncbi:MAG TPA: AAA family ATPase [Gaiellaceae bacterium]|nr:AAA family ATPase [Gaiellaceae bacterium]
MRRLFLGEYRSVGIFTLPDDGFDLGAITILYGKNGSGKTNILEALAHLFEWTGGTAGLTGVLRKPGTAVEGPAYPGSLVVELDRWREDSTLDQALLWRFLTNERARDVLLSYEDAARLPADAEAALDALFAQSGDPSPGRREVEAAIATWAQAAAHQFDDGTFDERYAVAHEALAQAIFQLPEGFPYVSPRAFSDAARAAATAILDAAQRNDTSRYRDDPVREVAEEIASTTTALAPTKASLEISTLPELGDEAREELQQLVAGITVIDGSQSRAEAALNAVVEDARATLPTELERLRQRLEDRANELLPTFLRAEGSVVVGLANRATLHFQENNGDLREYGDLGAGAARWLSIAAHSAAADLRTQHLHRVDGDELAGGSRIALYVRDEPESHLHPGAIRSVGEWLVKRNSDGVGIVVATHALELLNLPRESTDIFFVERQPGETSQARRVSDTLLRELQERGDALGVLPSDYLRVARGVLVVEGEHDAVVLNHFFGAELTAARALILRLRGAYEALALAELEYLARLQLPIVLLLDNIRKEQVERPRLPADATAEEKQWFKLRAFLHDPNVTVDLASHGLQDIIAALPAQAVAQAALRFGGAMFTSWDEVSDAAARRRVNLKDQLAQTVGVPVDARLLAEALAATDEPPPVLRRVVDSVIALLSDRGTVSG